MLIGEPMPQVIAVGEENDVLRRKFFAYVFGDNDGYIGVALKTKAGVFREAYFHYPNDLGQLLAWVNTNLQDRDLYFCPQLLGKRKREKGNVTTCPVLWSDLDEVNPSKVDPAPSVLVTSSEGRYQALWKLETPSDPHTAEDASRRLAYANNADISGWDLSQLLRIPLTYNVKYGEPEIITARIFDHVYKITDFDHLEDSPQFKALDREFPKEIIAKLDADEILEKYRRKLTPNVFTLYVQPPAKDWSSALWALESMLAEAGMTTEEIFVVARKSATNKYKRDGRSEIELWREVVKAKAAVDMRVDEDIPPLSTGPLLTEEERNRLVNLPPTFVDKYIEWGRSRSDAAWQYHQAGALTILSTILADKVKLETSFGSLVPNLWFMLLGDTTLTRKTTAMEMAIDLILTVSDEAVLATDGSIEGILTALGNRESRSSLFWRDEFSGMLDAMRKRDYHSGMVEALTKLYDGKYLKRVLRRETIEIRNPVFIMFTGGIKTRILELLDTQYVINGFLPRFIIISAEANLNSFRPVGPATNDIADTSSEVTKMLGVIAKNYTGVNIVKIGDQVVQSPKVYDASLSQEAWERYNALEETLVRAGIESEMPETYTPTMDRLSKSALKAAVLISASRQKPPVEVTIEDMIRAIALVEKWLPHSIETVQHAGKSASERTLERALRFVQNGRDSRAGVMRSMHLTSREMDLVLDTLEQRGLIIRTKYGKAEKLIATTLGGKKE